jgi:hypothetical protein
VETNELIQFKNKETIINKIINLLIFIEYKNNEINELKYEIVGRNIN